MKAVIGTALVFLILCSAMVAITYIVQNPDVTLALRVGKLESNYDNVARGVNGMNANWQTNVVSLLKNDQTLENMINGHSHPEPVPVADEWYIATNDVPEAPLPERTNAVEEVADE